MNATTAAEDDTFLAAARPFWHPIARSDDVAPGAVRAVRLLDTDLALWRDSFGGIGLVADRCVHRGTALSSGRVNDDGCVTCPYHGWAYDNSGACRTLPQLPAGPIPATARVAAYAVEESAGLVWACLAPDQRLPRPEFPEAGRAGWRSIVGPPVDWDCTASRNVENFIDMAHLGWIHQGTFGNPDVTEVDPYTVSNEDGHLRAVWPYPARIVLDPAEAPLVLPTEFDYRVVLPFTVRLDSRGMGFPNALLHAVAPVTATTCRTFWVVAVPGDADVPDALLEEAQLAVYEEDRAVVESQRPAHLPLDPRSELHLPFDRYAVAYRRALADLGF